MLSVLSIAGSAESAFDPADGVTLDPAETIRSHPAAAKVFDDPVATEAFRRAMARTAILLAKAKTA